MASQAPHLRSVLGRAVTLTAPAALAALSLFWVAPAAAQLAPEVILLLDSSTSMGRRPDQESPPTCGYEVAGRIMRRRPAPPGGPPPAGGELVEGIQRESRLMIAQALLSGSRQGAKDCLLYSAAERGRHAFREDHDAPFARPLCAVDGELPCGDPRGAGCEWIPCGEDHGENGRDPFASDHPPHFNSDGLISRANGRIRFAFMSSEGEVAHNEGRSGGYSYGSRYDRRRIRTFLEGSVQATDEQVGVIYNWISSAEGIRRPLAMSGVEHLAPGNPASLFSDRGSPWLNLGARGTNSPFGRLIYGGLGEPGALNLQVGEDPVSVGRHNELVIETVRSTIPHGPLSLSAMLQDLEFYLQEQEAQDPAFACRRRSALLVSDGRFSNLMPPLRCARDRDCQFADVFGRCVEAPLPPLERDSVEAAPACAGDCERVCLFPEGAPFEDPVQIARRLHDRGVDLFVLTVSLPAPDGFPNRRNFPPALEALYRVAEAGSPDLGADPSRPGLFTGEAPGALDALLSRLLPGGAGGASSAADARPLVVAPNGADQTPGEGVDLRLRQWRFAPSNLLIPGDESAGELEQIALGCVGEQAQSARLRELERSSYLESRERQRGDQLALTSPSPGELTAVITGPEPLFGADGIGSAEAERLTGVRGARLRRVGRRLQGYFGEVGLPEGENGRLGPRRYGANRASDLVALTPPPVLQLGSADAALIEGQRPRPTLLFYGTQSGLIHGLRAYDQRLLFSFVPMSAWEALGRGGSVALESVLEVRDLIPCRSAGDAGGQCQGQGGNLPRPVLLGGVGRFAGGLFGLDLLPVTIAAEAREPRLQLNQWDRSFMGWDLRAGPAREPGREPQLGRSVSRPLAAHVRVGQRIVAAMIVGCGDSPSDGDRPRAGGVGRCLLVLNAFTGELIKKLSTPELLYPVVGAPVGAPAGAMSPVDDVYVGDRHGQLWRFDLSASDPELWSGERIWPLPDGNRDEALSAPFIGRALIERPALGERRDGRQVILFGSSGAGTLPEGLGHLSSLSVQITQEEAVRRSAVELNWLLPFTEGEYATGSPVLRDQILWLTTSRPVVGELCGGSEGRLYGVHFTERAAEPFRDPEGDRILNVKPMIPRFDQEGGRKESALSLILPPGRTAHGLAVVPTPSCNPERPAFTELVLSMSEEEGREGAGGLQLNGTQAEIVQGNQLTRVPLNEDLQVAGAGGLFSIALTPSDNAESWAGVSIRALPFPAELFLWGAEQPW